MLCCSKPGLDVDLGAGLLADALLWHAVVLVPARKGLLRSGINVNISQIKFKIAAAIFSTKKSLQFTGPSL